MKRLPLLMTVAAVVALSASLAYWGLQLFKPPQRPIAAVPPQAAQQPGIEAARGLFGGQITVATASNYQLKGVVAARGKDSAAIVAVDGKPAMAVGVGREVAPGVTVKEVHPKYVLLSDGGALKRVELATDAGAGAGAAGGQPPSLLPGAGQQPLPPIAPPTPQAPPPQQPPPQQPPPRSSVSGTTIAPVPGFDRTQ